LTSSSDRPIDRDARTADTSGWRGNDAASASRRQTGPVTQIGDYRILRLLGEGGMGTVYLAEQLHPRRAVALKVVRAGFVTPALLRRFEFESQVLARLHHPGIAQVFEAGVLDSAGESRPFFAMEFVEGVTLDVFARAHSVEIRALVEVMAKIADAVHHAHQKGVIHRDLKPGNVLIDGSGQPKVLDFGVARATDADLQAATMQTDVGQLVGTLPYMSPEQIVGDPHALDTRTDVWSLGVMLYEMVTGRLPFDFARVTFAEAARMVRDDPVPAARSLASWLPIDLGTIVHKALEKDRDRRYASANDFASDLRAYLDDRPIMARPPSRTYHFVKFVRRNRTLTAALGVTGLSLVAATAISSAGLRRADAARVEAERESTRKSAMMSFLTEDLIGAADPAVSDDRDLTVRAALDRGAAQIDRAFEADPEARYQLHVAVGSLYAALGHVPEARPHLETALSIARERRGDDHADVFVAERHLGLLERDAGQSDDAVSRLRSTAERAMGAYGADSLEYAEARSDYGSACIVKGEPIVAEQEIGAAVPVLTAHHGADARQTLMARHNLATALARQGRLEESAVIQQEILDLRLSRHGERHPDTLSSLNNLATTLTELGRTEESEKLLRRVIEVRTSLLGAEHLATITARMNLAHLLLSAQRLDEGAPVVRENFEMLNRVHGEDHPHTLTTLNHLAILTEDLGDWPEAERLYREAIVRWERSAGTKNPNTLIAYNNLAMLLQRRGDLDDALHWYGTLDGAIDAALPPRHFYGAFFRNNYGDCLRAAKRFEDAETLLLDSHALMLEALPPGHERIAKARKRLAQLYDEWGQPEKAAPWRDPAAP